MLENASQSIAGDVDTSQELWNVPSQVYSIAACGWALFLGYVIDRHVGSGQKGNNAKTKRQEHTTWMYLRSFAHA